MKFRQGGLQVTRASWAALVAVLVLVSCSAVARANPVTGDAKLAQVATFQQPLYLLSPPGDTRRQFVVEQTGRIQILMDNRRLPAPFLDLSSEISLSDEGGLLSMAFPIDYATSRRFYVMYSDLNKDLKVEEFQVSPTNPAVADKTTRRVILTVDRPPDAEFLQSHYGGLLLFGPDNLLYIGVGDGGPTARDSQRLDSLQGKILRIDVRSGTPYTIPPSNPFVSTPGARPEIYHYGLRNPWRFAFDRVTRDLYIGDVGQTRREEVDFVAGNVAKGKNFGWPCFEGSLVYDSSTPCPGSVPPTFEYAHTAQRCSITGGVVSRDPAVPDLVGRYLYADLCSGEIRSLRMASGKPTEDRSIGGLLNVNTSKICLPSSFGVDWQQRVYAISLCGPVYRLIRP